MFIYVYKQMYVYVCVYRYIFYIVKYYKYNSENLLYTVW